MRVEYIPTIRGDMEFVAVTQAQSPVSGGTTYSVNVTGTTWSTSTSKSPTSISSNVFSDSATAAKTIPSYVTAETTQTIYGTTTGTTEGTKTYWTTATASGEQSLSFIQSASTFQDTQDYSSFQRTDTTISTTATVTVTANCVDTVYIAENNEWLMALTAPFFASNWDGKLIDANDYVEKGSQITMTADVRQVGVVVVYPTAVISGITTPSSTTQISYESLSDTGASTQTAVDFLQFPNKTSAYESPTFSRFELVQTIEGVTTESEFINHYGNTQSRTVWITRATTESYWTPDDYRTYSAYVTTAASVQTTVTTPSIYIDGGSAHGNTTEINDKQKLGLYFNAGAGNNEARCVVSKEYGVRLGDDRGLYFTLGDTVTVASSGVYAAIDRANSYLQNQIVTLLTASNADFTLSSNSLTWTTTTLEDGETVETTSSQTVQVEGEPATGIVTVKSVIGGQPEEGATFWDFIDRGAYYNESGEFTTFSNSWRSYSSGENYPTSALTKAWHIGLESFSDVVTVERNLVPPYEQL